MKAAEGCRSRTRKVVGSPAPVSPFLHAPPPPKIAMSKYRPEAITSVHIIEITQGKTISQDSMDELCCRRARSLHCRSHDDLRYSRACLENRHVVPSSARDARGCTSEFLIHHLRSWMALAAPTVTDSRPSAPSHTTATTVAGGVRTEISIAEDVASNATTSTRQVGNGAASR